MNSTNKTYYSNGKLLLTGEYLILDGALALAIPTKFGQSLTVQSSKTDLLQWKSLDHHGNMWFEAAVSISSDYRILNTNTKAISERLIQILKATKNYNSNFLKGHSGVSIVTSADFPQNWGLGTSSTLINNMAQWAEIDAYKLLQDTFGGSGYDIACAIHNVPITYQLEANGRTIIEREFDPQFKEHLYFVYLNKKQNSRAGIATYRKHKSSIKNALIEINDITNAMLACNSLDVFMTLLDNHEAIISKIIKQPTVKDLLFKDFNGSVKSLGAWGGDFVLVASNDVPTAYFKSKGYNTLLSYKEMVL